jgi:MFS-type transporter involved in bile tolerance (Atg22 family)
MLTYIHPKQKRNVMKVFMWIMIISIIGTVLVKTAEYMFGMVNVFMFAVAVTAIVGVIVVPMMQVRQRLANQKR